jgi:2-keto-4-pentenoate hydratase/2-oxohepta-3-ene-1,7-dioic acid hydratase in catechol pathway
MSFVSQGKPGWGIALENKVIDLSNGPYPTLKALLAAGGLEKVKNLVTGSEPQRSFDEISFLPVVPDPGKIVCVGVNYEEHRIETQREKAEYPTVFLRVAESQTGHKQAIRMPVESTQLDYEGEIAIVIGKGGRRISEADAWSHIAGYAPYNDGSVRDWQRHTSQWIAGKNFDSTGGFGPWMVTRDEIADGEILTLETRLNGQVMQHATTDMLIFSIPQQIAYISAFTTLSPGDVIVTGTPGGVGARRNPPVWMKPGDTVEVEVSKVGVLVNTID